MNWTLNDRLAKLYPGEHATSDVDGFDAVLLKKLARPVAASTATTDEVRRSSATKLVDAFWDASHGDEDCVGDVTIVELVGFAHVDQLGPGRECGLQLFDANLNYCHMSTLPGQIVDSVDIGQLWNSDTHFGYVEVGEGVEQASAASREYDGQLIGGPRTPRRAERLLSVGDSHC